MTKLFTYQIVGEYTTDVRLMGIRRTIKNKTFSWVLADCGQHLKLTRNKTAICYHCIQSKHIQAMEKRGLVVVDRVDAKHYKVIQPCGHEKVVEGNMVSYTSYCSACKDQKILSKCPDGTLITGFSELNKYVHLKLPCGHSTKRKAYADDNVTCLECRSNNKANLLSSISATEVEYSRYKLACGHTTGAVAWQGLDTYKCLHCERNAIWERARTFGLTATGSYNSECKTHEFILPCGHTKNLKTAAIKASVVCSVCAEDHYNKPCDMYMLIGFCEDSFRFVKVGVANDTHARLKMYQAKGVRAWALFASVGFDTKRQAVKIEKEFHKLNIEKRIEPTLMKKYLKEGFTECYPIDVFSDIQQEMARLAEKYSYSVHYPKDKPNV